MSGRTIINGNGWYLFGISHDEEILKKVDPVSNPGNALSDHIVSDHSADVEYAYVVQKHNPVRAWIKKSGSTYEVHTNSLLIGNEKFNVTWRHNGNAIGNSTIFSDKLLTTDDTKINEANYTGNTSYTTEENENLSVVVTKKNSDGDILEVLTASLEPLIVYGTNKGTTSTLTDEKYWTAEVNGKLEAYDNTTNSTSGFQWRRKAIGETVTNITDATGQTYTIQGDDASHEISVIWSGAHTAIYQGIGAASDPFLNDNWQKIIHPSGPQKWKNTTNSTIGVWVKIGSFFDTVPPKLAKVDGKKPNTGDELTSAVTVVDGTTTPGKQVITIPFSKELVIPKKRYKAGDTYDGITLVAGETTAAAGASQFDATTDSGNEVVHDDVIGIIETNNLHVSLSDFTVKITDNREYYVYLSGAALTAAVSNISNSVELDSENNPTGGNNANDGKKIRYNKAVFIGEEITGNDTTTKYYVLDDAAVGDSFRILGSTGVDDNLLIDQDNYKYRSSFREIEPESVAVSGRNLLLTLPLYNGKVETWGSASDQSGDKPQIYNSIYNDDLRIKDTVHVKYVRSNGTILKDKSQYEGANVWATDYGGVSDVADADKKGNLVPDFGYDGIDESSTHSLVFNWTGQITNNVTADNLAPIVRETEVAADGLSIRIRFSEALDNLSGESTSNFQITYQDKRSPVQRGEHIGSGETQTAYYNLSNAEKFTYLGASNNGNGTDSGNSYANANPTGIALEKWTTNGGYDTIKLTLANGKKIYKHFTDYSDHIVTVSYNGTFLTDPAKNDGSGGNVVQTFTDQSITNTSDVNNTYPAFSISHRIHTTISGGESSSATHHIELPKGESIINVSRVGTSGDYKVNFTIMAPDSGKTNTTQFFTLHNNGAVNNTDVKLAEKPNYTPDYGANYNGYETDWPSIKQEAGITIGTHYFRIQVTMDMANSTGENGNAATGSTTFEYTTPNITLVFTADNNLVRKKTTNALLKANKAVKDGEFILYYDKFNQDIAMGPMNGLTVSAAKQAYFNAIAANKEPSVEGVTNEGVGDVTNANFGRMVGIQVSFDPVTTSGSIFSVSIPANNDNTLLSGDAIQNGKTGNSNLANYMDEFPTNLLSAYANNNIYMKNAFSTPKVLEIGGAAAISSDVFYPHLKATNNKGTENGGSNANVGWYYSKSTSPFLDLESRFKFGSFKYRYKKSDGDDIGAKEAILINGEALNSQDSGASDLNGSYGIVFQTINV